MFGDKFNCEMQSEFGNSVPTLGYEELQSLRQN